MDTKTSRRTFLGRASLALAAPAILSSCKLTGIGQNDGIDLFDGKTLNGWHKNPERIGHGTGGSWYVEDGAIVGEQDPPGSGNGGILLTDAKFGDFEVSIDMNHDWGPCSGFFLRSNDKGQCFQVMVDFHDAGNVGNVYGEGSGGFNSRAFDINGETEGGKLIKLSTDKPRTPEEHGNVFACTPQAWLGAWKVGTWNTLKVRCVGKYPMITTWINGTQIGIFDGESFKGSGYDREKVHDLLGDEGSLAVQVHGGGGWPKGAKVRWKNIKVRIL